MDIIICQINVTKKETSRLNFKIQKHLREYLDEVAWQNKMDLTPYLEKLIEADMERHNRLVES